MLLTLSTTMPDATDLGFVLHKHPDGAQSFSVAFGAAHVVWPEATGQRSTVALLLEVDPIALVRGRRSRGANSAPARHQGAKAGRTCASSTALTTPSRPTRRLRDNHLAHKRSPAEREYVLGVESLERAVQREPPWRVHEAVFAVLALESEPVNPRW